MKRNLLLILCFIASLQLPAQSWTWTRVLTDSIVQNPPAGSTTTIESYKAAVDVQGNIVSVLGISHKNYSTVAATYIRVAKYDKYGRPYWVKYFDTPYTGPDANPYALAHVYDVETDPWGNIYMAARNYHRYDGVSLPVVNTLNCLLKFNANGELLWKRPMSATEGQSAPQYFKLAIHPEGKSLYAYFEQVLLSFSFLGNTFTRPLEEKRMSVCRIDTAGRLTNHTTLRNAQPTAVHAGFDVNKNDQVVVTATAYNDVMTVGDTTVPFELYNEKAKTVLALLDGADNFKRLWVRETHSQNNYDFSGINVVDARFTPNGNVGFLLELSRSDSDPRTTKQLTFADSTLEVRVPAPWENALLFVTSPEGRLLSATNLEGRRMILRGGNLATDDLGNFYCGGSLTVAMTAQGYYRFQPAVVKASAAGQPQWTNIIRRVDSSLTYIPSIGAREDYVAVGSLLVSKVYPVLGGDTLPVTGTHPALSMIAGKVNTIRGKVFQDVNQNGVQDANEDPFANLQVATTTGDFRTFTGADGSYSLICDSGTYSVSVLNRPRYHSVHPAAHSVTLNGYGLSAQERHFALVPDTIVTDLSVEVALMGATRPGFTAWLHITGRNEGNTPQSGVYTLKLPAGVSYIGSDSTATALAADSLQWSYTNLKPLRSVTTAVQVKVDSTTAIGTLLAFSGLITPLATDTLKWNNTDTAMQAVTGSYDPNDKLVNPVATLNLREVQGGKSPLEYTIRFQNTGNDTAFNIRIADTLSHRLNFATFQVLSSSHPVTVEWKHPNIVNFHFRNILLPDSNRNEPKSHGFVKYRVHPRTSLSVQDSIHNKADIYFDYNAPIVTNNASLVVIHNTTTPVTDIDARRTIKAYPNPTEEALVMEWDNYALSEKVHISLYDMQGRLYRTETRWVGPRAVETVQVGSLPPGTYILELRSAKRTESIRFIKR